MDGSYIIETFSTTIENEVKRLKAQVELFWEKEILLYKQFGLKDGMKILECGSGPGYVMEKLLIELPESQGVALEIDPYLFDILKNNKGLNELERCIMVKSSIMSTGLPDNSFDFVITRLVLEHLPDPQGAVREVLRVLKPGGKAVFINNDFDMHLRTYPEIPELAELYDAYCRSRTAQGGNPKIGRELPGLLRKNGFININLEIVSAHSEIVGDNIFLESEGVGISAKLVKDGYLSGKTLNKLAVKWRSLLKNESHAFFRQLFMAVGEKNLSEIIKFDEDKKSQLTHITDDGVLYDFSDISLNKIVDFITEQASATLEIDKSELKADIPLNSIGFDSLSAVDLQEIISSRLNIDISITNFFDGQTIADISELLFKMLSRQKTNDFSQGNDTGFENEWEEGSSFLSYNQQSLWFLYQLTPESSSYNIAAACRIISPVKNEAMQNALTKLINRHSMLKTTYGFLSAQDKIPSLRIQNRSEVSFKQINAFGWNDETLKEKVEECYKKPFNIENGPVFRAHLFTRNEKNHVFLLTVHHIVCDAWSLSMLLDDLKIFYQAEIDGVEAKLSPVLFDYTDFITSRNNRLNGPDGERLLSYWKGKLEGMTPYIDLPTDYNRPTVQKFHGSSQHFNIEGPSYLKIKNFTKTEGVTLFTVLLSIFQCILMRKSRQNDICIGIPTAGRNKRKFNRTCGFFVNPIVLRGNLAGTLTFRELLKETGKNIMEAIDHQDYPFTLLVDKLMPKRDPGRSPMFQVMFNMLNRKTLGRASDFLCPSIDTNPVDFGRLKILPFPINQQEGQYDITLEIIDTDSFLYCCLKYNRDIYTSNTIKDICDDFQAIIEIVLNDPTRQLFSLPVKREKTSQKSSLSDVTTRKLAISASFTPDLIKSTLEFWIKKIKIDSKIVFTPYNQIFQELLDPSSIFSKNINGINIVLLRFDDWLKEDIKEQKRVPIGIMQNIFIRNADEFVKSVHSFLARTNIPLLVLFCSSSPDLLKTEEYKSLVIQTESSMCKKLNEISGVYTVPSSEIFSLYPVEDYYEPMGDKTGHVPYTIPYFTSLATVIFRKMFNIFRNPYKVIILDADQTLWDGIVGEDGVSGIRIDNDKKAFQEFILSQKKAGLLLCLCSKNSEKDIMEVFDCRPDMALKKDHFASFRVNWLPKSQNIKSISKELNLSLDSFIFIDDNPVECAEVRSNCPAVLTIMLPDKYSKHKNISGFIKHIWAFDHLKITREDQNRSLFYKDAKEREKFHKETLSFADFIQGLDLKIEISNLLPSQIPRAAQLTMRTNQFNLSTKRRSENEIIKLCETNNTFVYTVTVSDRFGDYGLVGIMIVNKNLDFLNVDTFLLSCRALGKGIEHKMLAYLGAESQKWKLSNINLVCKPTEKNAPIRVFLTSVGKDYEQKKEDNLVFNFPVSIAAETKFNIDSKSEMSYIKTDKNKLSSSNEIIFSSYEESLSHIMGHIMEEIANDYYNIKLIFNSVEKEKKKRKIETGESKKNLTKPLSETEEHLALVLKDVLGLSFIDPHANFFELGASSILVLQVIIEFKKKYGIELDIIDIFKFPCIHLLAGYIDRTDDNSHARQLASSTLAQKQKSAIDRQRERTKLARRSIKRGI